MLNLESNKTQVSVIFFSWRNSKTLMRYSNLLPRLALLALVVPVAGFCASLQISSTSGGTTICETGIGTCGAQDTIPTSVGISPAPSSTSGSFSYLYTTNGDNYTVTGNYSASYTTGVVIFFNPTVAYSGNNGTTTTTDNITLDLYQDFYDNTGSSWSGSYCEYYPASIAANGSGSAALSYDGSSIGTLSASPGSSFQSKCTTLNPTAANNNYLNADFKVSFTFAPGAITGSTETSLSGSAVPEPSTMALSVIGTGSLFYFARRRRRSVN
jgi:hypothetical protein